MTRKHTVVISPFFYSSATKWLVTHHFTGRWDCDWYEQDMWTEHNGSLPKTWHFGDKALADEFARQFRHPYGYIDCPIDNDQPDDHQNKVLLYDKCGNKVGYMGDRYDSSLSTKEIAVKIRGDIKAAKRAGTLPAIKTSVASSVWGITITLYVDVNDFHLHKETEDLLRYMAERYNHVKENYDRLFITVRPDYSTYV